ncbi:MAG: hypothetical protein NZ954_07155 [Thermofilaceae archaeon]|nr:hypothetical protein [Thermofilaceae archaeon]MCX8181324.1 hypothetical protein [Thermofilaceae archaeon]MDW8003567.1 hypothetical protein [Thermofilaceae archaeon]
MQTLNLKNPETLVKKYEQIVCEAEPVKNVERGGSDLRKLDEAGTNLEFVITYTYKPGRFSKEKTVIAVIPVERMGNGVFTGDVSRVVFRSLSYNKGNFEEEWSGGLGEAKTRFPEIVKAFEEDVKALTEMLSKA